MARAVRTVLSCLILLALTMSAWAQTSIALAPRSVRGTISANGGSVTLALRPGESMGSAMLQTLDSYSGTVEVQCSLDGVAFDTDNEPLVNLVGSTTTASSITDTVGLWNINGIAGCRALKVIATAGFAASNVTLVITAIPAGGGSGVGGGGGSIEGTGTAGTPAGGLLTVQGATGMTPLEVDSDTIINALAAIESALTEGTAIDVAHGEDPIPTGPQAMCETGDIDGSAQPNVLTETKAIRQKCTLSGAVQVTLVNEAGTADIGASILTSVQLTDDIVGVEDVAETAGAGLARMGAVVRLVAAGSTATDNENATVNVDGLGRLWARNGNPCADHARITHAVISESTAATNEIVALNGSDLIYVCGYKWVTTLANSLSWTRGTGSDCGTGTTAIEGAQPYAANGGVTENGGGAPLFVVPAGNALCLVSSVGTAHGGRVSYVRTAAP